ncbi:hypothetical protein [Dactylosporangium sp. NPDC048998]|uniref:hypothetical protein n=1 Tax=Dactylosporangium sp. NPDC048998 TaxID=3363976 RepID=UPI003713C1B3
MAEEISDLRRILDGTDWAALDDGSDPRWFAFRYATVTGPVCEEITCASAAPGVASMEGSSKPPLPPVEIDSGGPIEIDVAAGVF